LRSNCFVVNIDRLLQVLDAPPRPGFTRLNTSAAKWTRLRMRQRRQVTLCIYHTHLYISYTE